VPVLAGRYRITAPLAIDRKRDGFQVKRTFTPSIPAAMINLKAFWYLSDEKLMRNAVCVKLAHLKKATVAAPIS
jgi:hypothetical protein